MKLTRRSFLGLLSAIPFTPLVAKDMGDFEFLPPERVLPPRPVIEPPKAPEYYRPAPLAAVGELRYNLNTDTFEISDGKEFHTLRMEDYQNG
jgi:hypothetical protein